MTELSSPPARHHGGIWRDTERCYRAVSSRDARFDGQFITAVRTTGIYCRPSCPAVTPKQHNVRFFPTAAAAQADGYRACRRCLPDAVPGSPEWDVRGDLAARAMRLITDGVVERTGVTGLAQRLGYSQRQLGRVLATELGAGPLALARAHRAHNARLLIETSDLSLTDVAFAAGFTSVRQFNDTIQEVFASAPSQMRARAAARTAGRDHDAAPAPSAEKETRLRLRLPFRPPFDAAGTLGFLAARAVSGVEEVVRDREGGHIRGYRRTLRLPHGAATVSLTPTEGYVRCELGLADVRDLSAVVSRVRRMLDLDADPAAVARALADDPALARMLRYAPGVRVPGAVDGDELVLRAMLAQQVSVPAAASAAGRLATALGERRSPCDEAGSKVGVHTLFPTAAAIAEEGLEVLRGPRRRVTAIRDVAAALAAGTLQVHVGRDPDELRAQLLAQPGIGPWTADYVLMRVLGEPDVLLTGDVALRNGAAALGLASDPESLAEYARAWRPWRSYAGIYLWRATAMTDNPHTRSEEPT